MNVEFYLKICIEFDITNVEIQSEFDINNVEFQTSGILINSLKRELFGYIVYKLRLFSHFHLTGTQLFEFLIPYFTKSCLCS